jgi:hypothetical protein
LGQCASRIRTEVLDTRKECAPIIFGLVDYAAAQLSLDSIMRNPRAGQIDQLCRPYEEALIAVILGAFARQGKQITEAHRRIHPAQGVLEAGDVGQAG